MDRNAPVVQNTNRRQIARHRYRRGNSHSKSGTPDAFMTFPPLQPAISITLIDPKPLTRQSLLEMLKNALPGHVRLAGASTIDELVNSEDTGQQSESQAAGLSYIILYIRNLYVTDGWVQQQLHLIRERASEVPVIMISDRDDTDDVLNALSQGVRGYIPTSIAAEVAIAALTLIAAGGTYVPADALRPEGVEHHGNFDRPEEAGSIGLNLTSRELAVIDLLREGNPNKLIAKKLNMRESTVKVHVRNILKKLRVSNRTHAATVANRLFAEGGSQGLREAKLSAIFNQQDAGSSLTGDAKAIGG